MQLRTPTTPIAYTTEVQEQWCIKDTLSSPHTNTITLLIPPPTPTLSRIYNEPLHILTHHDVHLQEGSKVKLQRTCRGKEEPLNNMRYGHRHTQNECSNNMLLRIQHRLQQQYPIQPNIPSATQTAIMSARDTLSYETTTPIPPLSCLQ